LIFSVENDLNSLNDNLHKKHNEIGKYDSTENNMEFNLNIKNEENFNDSKIS